MYDYYLGTMGFSYSAWKGVFYPAGAPVSDYLAYYSRAFNAVELDTTFYAVPRPAVVEQWASAVPAGFRFAAKTPRLITHEMGLADAGQFMDEFLEVMRRLGDRLGVILIQLPPGYTVEHRPRLEKFLGGLPEDIRFAVEFRHRTWYTPATAELLAARRIAWAATEYPHLPQQLTSTTDLLYIRWLGQRGSFRQYDREQVDRTPRLAWWWEQVQSHLGQTQAVYGFVNNDYAGYAPATCNRFKTLAGLPVKTVHQPEQGRLF